MSKSRTNQDYIYQNVNVFEAFAGIGSQYKALKNIAEQKHWTIKHSGMIEWFTYAIIAYVAIHSNNFKPKIESLLKDIKNLSNDSKSLLSTQGIKKLNNSLTASYLNYSKTQFNNLFDIRTVNSKNFPKNIDIFTYSFPCQDLSVQGLQKGMDKHLNTRSGLLWEVERIFKEIKQEFKQEELPKYLLMENVKNLLSFQNIKNYELWLKQLNDLGYESKTYLLNSQNFNNPQNRERVFCLSVRKDFKKDISFEFKELKDLKLKSKKLKDILVDKDYPYLDLSKYETTNFNKTKNNVILKKLVNYTKFNSENYIYSIEGIGPTLTASGANSRIKIETQKGIRFLSPIECMQYMSFEKEDYLKVKNTNLVPDTKIVYTAGNSIPVTILEEIFKTLKFNKE